MPDPIRSRTDVALMELLGNDLVALSQSHGRLYGHFEQASKLVTDLTRKLELAISSARNSPASRDPQVMALASTMHQAVLSFNQQYLQLQSRMQHENRSYTAISNIMKTKHDTVKNSINNVR